MSLNINISQAKKIYFKIHLMIHKDALRYTFLYYNNRDASCC